MNVNGAVIDGFNGEVGMTDAWILVTWMLPYRPSPTKLSDQPTRGMTHMTHMR